MKVEGVPDSITRADYLRLVASTGLDISQVRAVELRRDGIYVTVKARRPGGKGGAFITSDGYDHDEVAVHRIFIPVVDLADEPAPPVGATG